MIKLFLFIAMLAFAAASPAPQPAPIPAPIPEPKPGAILAAPAYASSYIAPVYGGYAPVAYGYNSYALPYYRSYLL